MHGRYASYFVNTRFRVNSTDIYLGWGPYIGFNPYMVPACLDAHYLLASCTVKMFKRFSQSGFYHGTDLPCPQWENCLNIITMKLFDLYLTSDMKQPLSDWIQYLASPQYIYLKSLLLWLVFTKYEAYLPCIASSKQTNKRHGLTLSPRMLTMNDAV